MNSAYGEISKCQQQIHFSYVNRLSYQDYENAELLTTYLLCERKERRKERGEDGRRHCNQN